MLFLRGEKKNRKENEIKRAIGFIESRGAEIYTKAALRSGHMTFMMDWTCTSITLQSIIIIYVRPRVHLSLSLSFFLHTDADLIFAKTERRYFIYCLMYSSSYLIFWSKPHTHTHTHTQQKYIKRTSQHISF